MSDASQMLLGLFTYLWRAAWLMQLFAEFTDMPTPTRRVLPARAAARAEARRRSTLPRPDMHKTHSEHTARRWTRLRHCRRPKAQAIDQEIEHILSS